ncbi:MAG: Hsp20/alpha crystallin family protein [Candidatus Kerfeldbacteria bacterium]
MVKKENGQKTEQAKQKEGRSAEEFFSAVLTERETKTDPPVSTQQEGPRTNEKWLNENFEGQLAVDVYQTDNTVVIQSTLAGVKVEDIDITVNNDMVTIRGLRRHEQDIPAQSYFYQECYWGGFSRSIILPYDVKGEKVSATLKNGILTVVLPKADKPRSKNIKVREEYEEDGS